MLPYFFNYTMPLFHLGLRMSERGVLADPVVLGQFKERLTRGVELKNKRFDAMTFGLHKLHKTIKKVKTIVEVEQSVNAASPQQLMTWLYEELGLPKQFTKENILIS